MERFLKRHSIVELEKLFKVSKDDPKTLKMLEDELMCRKLHRAQVLLSKVEKTLRIFEAGVSSEEKPKGDIRLKNQ